MSSVTRATTPKRNDKNCEDGKIINDPIHGTMYFNPLIIDIIDTPQFQRLRDIKQLGATSYIYPGGVHTRFEHSLGTCHITNVFLNDLKVRNPHVSTILNTKVCVCIGVAALCHDLGQGPFSRLYQDPFLCRLKEIDWSHSNNALRIFDIIRQQPRVAKRFVKFEIDEADMDFIKLVMKGEVPKNNKVNRFLYEIVSNKRNGIDCDTMDKILRDFYYVGIKHGFNHARLMESAKICMVSGENRLCFRYKEQLCVSELFDCWWKLQCLVYTHKTTRAIEMMIAEAMDKADEHFGISEARDHPGKLLMLSDSILHQIRRIDDDGNSSLKAAKAILERIDTRDLYQFCGQTSPLPTDEEASLVQSGRSLSIDHDGKLSPGGKERQRQKEIHKLVTLGIINCKRFATEITERDLLVDVIVIRYGNGYNDPLDSIDFVNKEGKLVARSPKGKQAPKFLKSYQEEYIRVYARDKGKIKEINNRFWKWCDENDYDVPQDMEKIPIENDDRDYMPKNNSVIRRLDFGTEGSDEMSG